MYNKNRLEFTDAQCLSIMGYNKFNNTDELKSRSYSIVIISHLLDHVKNLDGSFEYFYGAPAYLYGTSKFFIAICHKENDEIYIDEIIDQSCNHITRNRFHEIAFTKFCVDVADYNRNCRNAVEISSDIYTVYRKYRDLGTKLYAINAPNWWHSNE